MKRIPIFAAAVLSIFQATANAQNKRIPAAYSAVSATQSPFYLTQEAGYFEKHGLSSTRFTWRREPKSLRQ